MVFFKYAVEGTVNSMEQRLEFFVKLMAKNSISREKLSDRLLLLIILHRNMMNLLNLWIEVVAKLKLHSPWI